MRDRDEIVLIEDKAGAFSCSTLTFLTIYQGDDSSKHQRPYLEVIHAISLKVLRVVLPLIMTEVGFANALGGCGSAQSSANTIHGQGPGIIDGTITHEPPPKYAEHTGSWTTLGGPLPERPPELPVIAVMGPTGSGKSTLISKLACRPVKIGHNLESCKCS